MKTQLLMTVPVLAFSFLLAGCPEEKKEELDAAQAPAPKTTTSAVVPAATSAAPLDAAVPADAGKADAAKK